MNLLTLPFRILPQSLIPQSFLIQLSNQAIRYFYSQYILTDGSVNPFISQTIIFDQVVYFLSAIFITIGIISYKIFMRKKEKILAKVAIFSFILMMLSSIPFAFIPGKAANFSIFEPRDLHVTSIGASLLIVLVVYLLMQLIFRNEKYINIAVFIILIPMILMHIKLTRAEIYKIVGMSQARKSILNTIVTQHPLLSQNTLFYFQSDKAYYGLSEEEKIVPFQSGFGQTLMIWYYLHGDKLPACFFENNWLYDLLEQGYRSCSGRGFGYFRNYDDLVAAIKKYNLPLTNIIAFSWEDNKNILTDTTDIVRTKLEKDL